MVVMVLPVSLDCANMVGNRNTITAEIEKTAPW